MTDKPRELWLERIDTASGKRVPQVIRDYEEYQRRNLLVAGMCGVTAEAAVIRDRVMKMKRPPKWLLKSCDVIESRAVLAIPDLVRWRGLVGPVDVPGGNRD